MAKKGQPAQLQIEVNNDEEWEKLLQKDGLIVVDVYSEWCGPCLGMQANLRKIKLEFGGDMLQLAIAKSDGITALERFKNKCEPTWMFISKGKMVALMFGADAPKLRKLIIEELTKEQAQLDGKPTDRTPMEVTELAEEERIRYDVLETKQREIREKEAAKKAKELLDRRTKECENILTNLPNYGTALIFPSAKDTYKGILHEILDEAGLNINQTEKIHLDEDAIEDLCFFTTVSDEFSEGTLEQLLNNECIIVLFKISARAEIEDIDHAILTMIYGHNKVPPGAEDSVARKLICEVEEEKVEHEQVGVWVPPTPRVRATALRIFFPKVTSDFTIPAPLSEPEHLAIIFPLNKMEEFAQLEPLYMSPNAREGRNECQLFFPDEYEPETEDQEEEEIEAVDESAEGEEPLEDDDEVVAEGTGEGELGEDEEAEGEEAARAETEGEIIPVENPNVIEASSLEISEPSAAIEG